VHYERRLAAACEPYTDRFEILDKLFDAHHPTEAHHHLAFLAIAPDKQCTGRGTALLQRHHARLNRIGLPAYLEASSSGSRDLYARHGYLQREPFHLPNGSAFYPMWRPVLSTGTEPGS
jgi:predicted N-acetyltransferase YhbS